MSNIYFYISGTILFTVYGQLILKYRMSFYDQMPIVLSEKIIYILKLFLDPLILSGLIAAFAASLFWLATLSTQIELSRAYPFTIISFVLVVLFSAILFKENINIYIVIGILLIITGIYLISKTL